MLPKEPVSRRRLQPDVPRDLETICLKCLEKKGPNRYGSAEGVAGMMPASFLGRRAESKPPITQASG